MKRNALRIGLKAPQAVKRIDKKLGQNYYYLDASADASRGSQARDNDNKGYLCHELLQVQKTKQNRFSKTKVLMKISNVFVVFSCFVLLCVALCWALLCVLVCVGFFWLFVS